MKAQQDDGVDIHRVSPEHDVFVVTGPGGRVERCVGLEAAEAMARKFRAGQAGGTRMQAVMPIFAIGRPTTRRRRRKS